MDFSAKPLRQQCGMGNFIFINSFSSPQKIKYLPAFDGAIFLLLFNLAVFVSVPYSVKCYLILKLSLFACCIINFLEISYASLNFASLSL